MNASVHKLWWLAVVLFFASGLSSLIYQVLWMHTLVLVFGGTTLATSTVLAVFMGGLALGSFLSARLADRVRNPFLSYGILEGAIGLWAVLAPLLFSLATPLYQMAYQQFGTTAAINLVRFATACVILLPPTTCMGATLPLLARMVTVQLESLGNRVGLLYSVNTVGAVVGTVLGGFFLLPSFGLSITTWVAVAINFALAAIVIYANKRYGVAQESPSEMAEPPVVEPLSREIKMVVALFGIAGAVSMVYEVAWTRALLLVIGSSTYAFSVMLAAFLCGIVGGSWVCSRIIDRNKEPLAALAILELLAGLAAFLGLIVFGFLPFWNLQLGAQSFHHPWAIIAVRFFLAGIVLMPLTFCIGATFPAVVKASTKQLEQVGRSVGTVYAANTLGAIVGAFAAGFLLLPAIGAEQTLVYAAIANIAIGAAFVGMLPDVRQTIKIAVAAAAVVLVLAVGRFPAFWDQLILLSAQSERREIAVGKKVSYPSYQQWSDELHKAYDLLFYKDGIASNVAITQGKRSKLINLLTNGHVDASNGVDMAVQEMLSYFPLWCKPDAKTAAVVGWGSGVSVGAAGLFPLKKIDAIELEPSVIEAARFFDGVNHKPESDPRLKVIPNDGRNYLLGTKEKYDVIISEPSNPWQSGVCNLFTREYFSICRQRLNDGGILSLWLQIAEVSPDSIKQITSALSAEFPNTLTLQPDRGNVVILASNKPIKIDWNQLVQSMRNPEIHRDLHGLNVRSAEDVLGRIIMADDGLRTLCKGAPANTDDRNRVEYEVAKTYESRLFVDDNNTLLRQHIGTPAVCVDWGQQTPTQLAVIQAKVADSASAQGNDVAAQKWIASALDVDKNSEVYRLLGIIDSRAGRTAKAETDWQEAMRLDPHGTAVLRTRAATRIITGNIDGARRDYEQALAIDPADSNARYSLARLYAPRFLGLNLKQQEPVDAAKVIAVLGNLPRDAKVLYELPNILFVEADAQYRLGHYKEAASALRRYLAAVPNSFPAAHLMSKVALAQGDKVAADEWHARALESARRPAGLPRFAAQARQLIAEHKVQQAQELLAAGHEYDPEDREITQLLESLR